MMQFKIANDNAHKDAASIAMKLLKHSAFEAELKANAARLEQVNKVCKSLFSLFHAYAKGELIRTDLMGENLSGT